MIRNYIVHYKRGRLAISVDEAVIKLRGEHTAVTEAAWRKLMGENNLGELVDPKSPTRDILIDEIFSRPAYIRDDVWYKFQDTIKYTWVSNG